MGCEPFIRGPGYETIAERKARRRRVEKREKELDVMLETQRGKSYSRPEPEL